MRAWSPARAGWLVLPAGYDGDFDRHQTRRGSLVDPGHHCLLQVAPQITALPTTGLVYREATRYKVVTALGPGWPRNLALEHQGTQRLLSVVVGRRYRCIRRERSQRWPQLEQVAAGVGRSMAVRLRAALHQQAIDAPTQHLELLGRLALMVPTEQHIPSAQ